MRRKIWTKGPKNEEITHLITEGVTLPEGTIPLIWGLNRSSVAEEELAYGVAGDFRIEGGEISAELDFHRDSELWRKLQLDVLKRTVDFAGIYIDVESTSEPRKRREPLMVVSKATLVAVGSFYPNVDASPVVQLTM